ncbi:MAG: helix-turn-helix domain-containing protein [Candidatus Bathyarchaeia archaeon]
MPAEETLKVLQGLGLTEYEARTYTALVSLGSATPRDVASVAGVPYPSVYDALETLSKKGWVEVAMGRPRRYRARPPELMERDSVKVIKDAFIQLKELYESADRKAEKPEIIYTISGRKRVVEKIREMLSRAEAEVTLVLPNYGELAPNIKQTKNLLIESQDKIRLVTEIPEEIPEGLEVKLHKPVLAVDILVDGREAMISMPDYSVCGWVENPLIAKHFKEFLELLWANLKPRPNSP